MPQDSIEREVTIEAPVERVWSVITEAEHLGRWFGDAGAEIELRPGGELTMRWESGDTARARVEAVEPPRRFAYRWFHYSHVDDGGEHTPANSTLVEFTLTPDGARDPAAGRGDPASPASPRTRRCARRLRGQRPRLAVRAGRAVTYAETGGRLTAQPAPEVLAALADPTRWRVLSLLAERGEGTATTLAGELPVSRVAVVKHLAVLDRAGLVAARRAGREVRYTVRPERLGAAAADLAALRRRLGRAPRGDQGARGGGRELACRPDMSRYARQIRTGHRDRRPRRAPGRHGLPRQLLALGLSPAGIHRRVKSGRLHPVFAGVYAVGHRAIGLIGRQWAAVLACGEGAALSHWSAGAAWRMLAVTEALMHVTAGRSTRRRRGIHIHRRSLDPDEITSLDGLRITTPARTTIDLAAAGLRGRKLEAALDAAVERELDFSDLHRLLDRHRGRGGVPAVSALLERYTPGTVDTRSVLEDIVLDLCDAHGIPRPLVNAIVAGRQRDFFWPDVPLVVEADSYRWHRSPGRLAADRRRDVELTLVGIPFLRFSYEQIVDEPRYVAGATLAALTPRGRAAPRPARCAGARRR